MPAITSGLVLVTGASGYLGTYSVKSLLDAGFSVRATVRSDAKGKYLLSLYPGKKIEYVVVPEMNKDGAYDEAVKGVDAVLHLASPLDLSDGQDSQATIDTAVKGVTNILDAVDRTGANVKRVVQVSSIASVAGIGGGGVFDETNWNDDAVEAVKTSGDNGMVAYVASKVIAERAFWDAINGKKYDGVSLLPGLIAGTPLQYNETGGVTGSLALIAPFVSSGASDEVISTELYPVVDVRDTAEATTKALTTPGASGERILIHDELLFGIDVAQAGNKVFPAAGINAGTPDLAAKLHKSARIFKNDKSKKILGMKYRPKEETLEDSVKAILAKQ